MPPTVLPLVAAGFVPFNRESESEASDSAKLCKFFGTISHAQHNGGSRTPDAVARRVAEFGLGLVAEMRVFEGLSGDEIAQQLNCSPRTVANLWTFAKRWPSRELAGTA